jgi:hypothetical protein
MAMVLYNIMPNFSHCNKLWTHQQLDARVQPHEYPFLPRQITLDQYS